MSTALVLGNGNLLVNINDCLQVTDFYYPHVGQENHLANFANKLFFRINGKFYELIHEYWDIDVRYDSDSLVGKSTIRHKETGVKIELTDFVTTNDPIFLRCFKVSNESENVAEVMIFFQNNFGLFEYDIGDTALWYPKSKSLVHYKKNRYISCGSTGAIYQFTCAARTDNNNLGAYPDWKTGELYFNPISNGSVNSCISYKYLLKPQETVLGDNYMIAGKNLKDVEKLGTKLSQTDTHKIADSTVSYWKNWINSKVSKIFPHFDDLNIFNDKLLDEKLYKLYKRSLLTIRSQMDNGGAIIAANDARYIKEGGKDTYSYFWPRDGAYVSLALIECGYQDLAESFFDYASKLISPDGYFLHKYYPYGGNGGSGLASSWHPWVDNFGNEQIPIQEDETALVLYALGAYYEKFAEQEFVNKHWEGMILPMANFLGNYRYTIDYEPTNISNAVNGYSELYKVPEFDMQFAGSKLPRPSYDIWEEYRAISTFTCCSVYAGLLAGSKLSAAFGRDDLSRIFSNFANDLKDAVLKYMYDESSDTFINRFVWDNNTSGSIKDLSADISVYALWHFGLLDVNDRRIEKTMAKIEAKLVLNTSIGGVARHENDRYNRLDNTLPGNPWFICSLWMAQYYIQKGDFQKAKEYLSWVVDHADLTGLLAEQAHPYTGHGESVKPLTWSHSEFVRTVNMMKR